MCSGYYPELFNVHLDLEPTPAADPSWLLYTGELKTQHQFQDILTTVEVSALYLKANGKIYGIIQGRILNNKGLPPTYFSVSSETGFAGLSKTTIRGFPIAYTSNGHTSDYVSRFMISHRQ